MLDTLSRYLAGISNELFRRAVRIPLTALIDRLSSQPLTSAGLVINAAGATFAKIGGSPFYASVVGKLVMLAAGTALPAPVGVSIAAGMSNVLCYFVDAAGVITMVAGTPAATLLGITWPEPPRGKALIGCLIITAGATFTGGTTALDAATTVYISPLGPFDPTALV